MKFSFWIIITLSSLCDVNAQLKSLDHLDRIDIIQWNMEWFGDTSYGPTNEKLQFNNALNVVRTLNADIFTLCEVSDSLTWLKFKDSLDGYQGEISTWIQKQKTAILFKKNKFKLIYKKQILGSYYTDFASGRLPLEICLETTVNGKKDSIYIIVIHLKSNVGTTTQKDDAYNRRKNSSVELISYLDANFKSKKVIVSGDWNDDFDVSIWQNYATPFANINQNLNYIQATKRLTLNSIGTTSSYPDPIDHFVFNNNLENYWVKDSVFVINPSLDIKSFSSNTSDHFPVYCGFYDHLNLSSVSEFRKENKFYFNGNQWVSEGMDFNSLNVLVLDFCGKIIFQGKLNEFIPRSNNIYYIQFNNFSKKYIYSN